VRSAASSTRTERPARCSFRAAISPLSPAPTTTTPTSTSDPSSVTGASAFLPGISPPNSRSSRDSETRREPSTEDPIAEPLTASPRRATTERRAVSADPLLWPSLVAQPLPVIRNANIRDDRAQPRMSRGWLQRMLHTGGRRSMWSLRWRPGVGGWCARSCRRRVRRADEHTDASSGARS
jgi:hypothetical protein